MRLDLHGVKHQDVKVVVEDFLFNNKNPMYIVTGNSDAMKSIVIEILDKNDFKWMIMSKNLGEIIIL